MLRLNSCLFFGCEPSLCRLWIFTEPQLNPTWRDEKSTTHTLKGLERGIRTTVYISHPRTPASAHANCVIVSSKLGCFRIKRTNVRDWNWAVLKGPWAPASWWITRSSSKAGLRSWPAPDISHSWGADVSGSDPVNMMSAIFATDYLLLPVNNSNAFNVTLKENQTIISAILIQTICRWPE